LQKHVENPPTIIAAKLELGSHQTLAHQDADGNWVLNDPPPNKALELAKCQRYQIFGANTLAMHEASDAKGCYCYMSLPVTMRAKPAMVGEIIMRSVSNNTAISGATVSIASISPNGIDFRVTNVAEPVYFYGKYSFGLDANL